MRDARRQSQGCSSWHAEPVHGRALAAEEEGLPRTLADGSDEAVLVAQMPLGDADDEVRALASLHLTTCTIANGSRKDGRAWCAEGALDEEGSITSARIRADLLDTDGAVCDVLGAEPTARDRIDLYRHHRLLSLELVEDISENPCGSAVRVSARVR